MNITSLNSISQNSVYKKYFINNKNNTNPKSEMLSYKKVSPQLLKAYYFTGTKQKSKISSLEPDFNLLNCDYSNIDEFSSLFSKKLNSQLMTISKQDIKALVLCLKEQTGASCDLIKEVLYNLTLCSNYQTVDYLEELINKYQSADFRLPFDINGKTSDFSTNSSLHYLISEKALIKPAFNNDNMLFILDGVLLKELEESMNNPSKREFCEIFLQNLKKDKLTLLNIKGWDVKCSDGSYKSANFLFGTAELEQLALDVIKRVQKGENIDKILYSDFEENLNNIFKNLLYKYEIKVHKESPVTKKDITIDDIYENIKTPSVSKERIKTIFDSFYNIYGCQFKRYSKEKMYSFIAKYLDEQTLVFSVDSLAYHLKTIKEKIDEQLKKDGISKKPLYCVGDTDKSFIYITNLFARVNGIDPSDIFDFNQDNLKAVKDKRPVIFLDDISASAQTSKYLCNEIRRYAITEKFPFYLANVIICKVAKEILSSPMPRSTAPDAILSPFEVNDFTTINAPRTKYFSVLEYSSESKISELKKDMKNIVKLHAKKDYKLMDYDSITFIQNIFNNGFSGSCLSVAFPYMIPDNDCDFSALLFDNLLIKSKNTTNKALSNEVVYEQGLGPSVIEKLQEALLGT